MTKFHEIGDVLKIEFLRFLSNPFEFNSEFSLPIILRNDKHIKMKIFENFLNFDQILPGPKFEFFNDTFQFFHAYAKETHAQNLCVG